MSFDQKARLRLLGNRLKQLRKKDHIPEILMSLVESVYTQQIEARAKTNIELPENLLTPLDQLGPETPLLPRPKFPIDRQLATELFDSFLGLLHACPAPLSEAAKCILSAREAGNIDLDALFTAHLDGDDEPFNEWGKKTPESPRCMNFLIQSAMAPGLAAIAAKASERLNLNEPRHHGYCPVCGSLPLITELRDKEGFRHATCSFCLTAYRIPRIMCAFCGESDMKKLSYFTAEGEDGYRVDVCESCKMYIKCADFRKLDRKPLAIIDDLDSLSLDILAVQDGYSRPTYSGLGF